MEEQYRYYVVEIRGYREVAHKPRTVYVIFRNKHNAISYGINKWKDGYFCERAVMFKTNEIDRETFLNQYSGCAIFNGCQAKIPHTESGFPIKLWWDKDEGVGFFCKNAIEEMAKKYPDTSERIYINIDEIEV